MDLLWHDIVKTQETHFESLPKFSAIPKSFSQIQDVLERPRVALSMRHAAIRLSPHIHNVPEKDKLHAAGWCFVIIFPPTTLSRKLLNMNIQVCVLLCLKEMGSNTVTILPLQRKSPVSKQRQTARRFWRLLYVLTAYRSYTFHLWAMSGLAVCEKQSTVFHVRTWAPTRSRQRATSIVTIVWNVLLMPCALLCMQLQWENREFIPTLIFAIDQFSSQDLLTNRLDIAAQWTWWGCQF